MMLKQRSRVLKLNLTVMTITFLAVFYILTTQSVAFAVVPQVAAGWRHTVGLKSDGTVVVVGTNAFGQCDVGTWTNIVQVTTVDSESTVGMKSDGTVVAVGFNGDGQLNVGTWTDIVEIATGPSHTVGVKSDGTVVAVGRNLEGQCDVGTWADIVQVAVGTFHTVGLKSDGTVVAVGRNLEGQCDVGTWIDIVQIAAGYFHTVGLKSDGLLEAAGSNGDGQLNVGTWNDIVQVATGSLHTVGLKDDGTVVAVGCNASGQTDVNNWSLQISEPNPDNAEADNTDFCFIATAAYGSPMEPYVKILRDFRDRFLLTSYLGNRFVDFYYTHSPPMADLIAKHESLQSLVRWGLLPLVGVSWFSLKLGPVVTFVLLLSLLFLISATTLAFYRKIRLRSQIS